MQNSEVDFFEPRMTQPDNSLLNFRRNMINPRQDNPEQKPFNLDNYFDCKFRFFFPINYFLLTNFLIENNQITTLNSERNLVNSDNDKPQQP